MENVVVKFKKIHPLADIPQYMSDEASGMDIRACIDAPYTLLPGEFSAIGTGLIMEIPRGNEIQVRPRSGLAFKNGITVLNAPGTIDSDYRGEIKVILINHSKSPFVIRSGDRIAQLVVASVVRVVVEEVVEVEGTERGAGGLGSTGVK
jgi:dUTP pyrophosphatase